MIYSSPFPDARIPEVPLVEFVFTNAAARMNKPALIDGITGRTVSYGQLAGEIRSAASGLADSGVRRGDVVAIFGPNSPEYVTAFYAVTTLGACVTTLNPLHNIAELSYQLTDSAAKRETDFSARLNAVGSTFRPQTLGESNPEASCFMAEQIITRTASDTVVVGQPSPAFEAEYQARLTTAAEAMSRIPNDCAIALGLSPCQPPALLAALADRGKAKDIKGVRVYYSVSGRHMRNTILRFEQLRRFEPHCLFFGATERELATRARAEGRGRVVHFIPNYFFELDRVIPEHLQVDTFITTVSPMDADGNFSFGTNSDYSVVMSRRCKRIVVEVNRHMPRVHGPAQIHVSEVAAIVENHTPLEAFPVAQPKDLDPLVARNVVDLIQDGATFQMGIGGLPGVVCRFLSEHNDLGIHTELLTPPMAGLMKTGVVNNRLKKLDTGKTVFTFALGDRDLYEFMNDNPCIEGRPVSYVNDPRIISQQDRFISINSTLEIDLTGQCNSECLGGYQYSGAGGQVDFVRGAFASRGGKSIMVLNSTASDGTVTRIVPRLHGPVTTGRMDTHWVVTEHGAVCLKGKSERERMHALISIAAPQFRDELEYHAQQMRWA